ncbi:Polysaccharide biosynthesis protein [Fibrobacter sp. UWB15]|uniref:oligosaccharide flippase family protein n=1 Tax=unclassified Fibrobacter TaxID=2634177 RepID=UPI000919B608|nr:MULTISPECIES: oligosaccharide flippase family protein [unclassified Fibrobacter]PWJ63105.1 polysaccharide biosynthesis protein [Fibrobacter sp. UWB6]SHG40147.1 Polysaccharide biosynthesis protein [Fibrobacter sp. UWB8]SMG37653.1 Polysaccharide biosynthesis protein [Fibrobacter sp. UWB15]
MQALRNIKIGVFISLVNVLIQGVSVLVQNLIANNLGIVKFGSFGILQSDYTIFCALADFGMATLILAFFGKRATSGALFTNVLQLRLFMTTVAAIAMVVFAFTVRRGSDVFEGELVLALGLLFQHAFFDWYFICGNFWKKLLISKVLHTLSYCTVMGIALWVLKLDSIPLIALAMVIAALPAFGFGVGQAFTLKIFRIGLHTVQFFKLMFKSACPYALSSIASFAYLPVGLYTVAHFTTPEFLGAYNFSHKLVILASGLMVHFISSSLITLHQTDTRVLHLRDQAVFTLFIAAATTPFWLFPQYTLRIIFFAAPWTPDVLETSCYCLRILACSLILQATRMGMISTLLKEKRTWLYGTMITIGGVINIAVCIGGASLLKAPYIPALTLSGDLCLSLFLLAYFVRNRRFRW